MEKHQFIVFIFISILNLIALTYPLFLGNIKTNGLITLSKDPIKHLELVFV